MMTKKLRKKVKPIIAVSLLLIGSLFLLKPSMARYIYNGIKNYYYESQGFYFNCDKLSEEGALIQLDNWDGVNTVDLEYHLDSYKNNSLYAPSNITYDIEKECTSTANITCTISKETGLVSNSTHKDYFLIKVIPNEALSQGAKVTVEVTVTSTSPYRKVLTGTATINVGVPGISYEIADKVNSPYLDFKITNTLNYYRVVTPFGDEFNYGRVLSDEVYNNLSDEDKAKCTSALIELTFDPNVILVDVTSDFYDNAYSNTTVLINNKEYINGITFGMEPVSSMTIRFYKVNASNNYTYPSINPTSIIHFQAL